MQRDANNEKSRAMFAKMERHKAFPYVAIFEVKLSQILSFYRSAFCVFKADNQ